MVRGCVHPYGCPRPVVIYLYIYTDIRADVRVELSVLDSSIRNMIRFHDVDVFSCPPWTTLTTYNLASSD